MPCPRCEPWLDTGPRPIVLREFEKDFEIIDAHGSSIAFGGRARCKDCGEAAEYGYEELHVIKLWVKSIPQSP
jgi:hypothetical protein